MKNRPGQGSEQEGPRLEQLSQRLAKVETAVRSLDGFLATVKEVKAKDNEAQPDWERDEQAWQRLHSAAEQSERADHSLRAASMTLAADGMSVTCQDIVTSLSQRAHKSQERRGTRPNSTDKRRQLAEGTSLEKDSDLSLLTQEKEKYRESYEPKRSGGSFQVRSDEGEKGGLVQRRLVLLVSLRETAEAAEGLRLQEPSLPALQHR